MNTIGRRASHRSQGLQHRGGREELDALANHFVSLRLFAEHMRHMRDRRSESAAPSQPVATLEMKRRKGSACGARLP